MNRKAFLKSDWKKKKSFWYAILSAGWGNVLITRNNFKVQSFFTLFRITLAHERTWWMRSIIYLEIKAFWQRHQSRTFSFKIKASKRTRPSPLKYFNQGLTQKVQEQDDLQQSPGPPVVLPHWGGTGRSLHMCSCSEASQPCAPSVLGATSSHQ